MSALRPFKCGFVTATFHAPLCRVDRFCDLIMTNRCPLSTNVGEPIGNRPRRTRTRIPLRSSGGL
jgi:hypothetical protein